MHRRADGAALLQDTKICACCRALRSSVGFRWALCQHLHEMPHAMHCLQVAFCFLSRNGTAGVVGYF